jgi:serine palmitoyltransferase
MPFLKKTIAKLRGQSKGSNKALNNNNNNNNIINSSTDVTKTKLPTKTQCEDNHKLKLINNDHDNDNDCNSIENDLYSSSGSTFQATLFSENTEDASTSTSASGSGSASTGSVDTDAEADADADVDNDADADISSSMKEKRCRLTKAKTKNKDPYADVRSRMEALSLHSRMVHAYHSQDSSSSSHEHNGEPTMTFFAAWTTYLGYAVIIFVGHIRELCSRIFQRGRYISLTKNDRKFPSNEINSYAPLLKSFENFYTQRIYHRIQDCFNRPVASNPGAKIDVLERISFDGNKTMQVLGELNNVDVDDAQEYKDGEFYNSVSCSESGDRVTRRCLNLGSYNYLGFADDWDSTCKDDVMESMNGLPVCMGSSRMETGTSKLHDKVEKLVAEFIGKESAMVLNMGFNTNATTIPALMGHGDLIVSDELNHTSIVNGARTSGSAIRCFRHNDIKHLEEILKEAIVMGQPRTRRPWKKIMVIVEGIYSMEGEYCDLRSIVNVCKKYGVYVYLDEAHSIGAMGSSGRGITEYTGVDPADVNIMMGTFTKSFGGMGGYIAGDKDVIDLLKKKCAASSYHNSLSPIVCQQVISSFEIIMGRKGGDIGKKKINALRDNSNYFRMHLGDMGLHVLGHYDSPIMPVMLYNPTKVAAFSRECMKRGLAVVVVGFPAVPILMSRARFCISASHTREDLDRALKEIDEVADILKLRYSRSRFG